MINFIQSYNFAIKYAVQMKTKKIPKNKYKLVLREYLGLDNNQIPLRIYYSHKITKKTVIIFLGASPDGENHPTINLLAKNLASLGYNVFIPRIPPLMQLDISNVNVNWMRHIYNLIQNRKDVNPDNIVGFGISDQQDVIFINEIAHGAVVGSAIIREMEKSSDPTVCVKKYIEKLNS